MKFLVDFFPVLLFFVAYKLWGIFIATGVAVGASIAQVGAVWLRRRRVEPMHLATLAILVVFGGLTLLLQDQVFIMWKPSVINWLFAAVFFGSRFVGDKTLVERMMSHAIEVPSQIWSRLNNMWVLFFLAMGAANLYVASGFFSAEERLRSATGRTDIDLTQCAELFDGAVLELCRTAHTLEETWVNFKLFGMLGLTIAFVIVQAFYLARHVRDEQPAQ
jgi:intracellular septation protein